MTPSSQPLTGAASIALAVAFNVPYAILAATFEYPAILRVPASEVLTKFAEGGPGLVLTWYAFALSALALVPVAFALSLTRSRISAAPALAIGAAVTGALAGVMQAVGLLRWVFAVPTLAAQVTAPDTSPVIATAASEAFIMLNQYGGVAIGEHLGQLLTALFVALVSVMQFSERKRASGVIGILTAAAIVIGTGEGVAIAIGEDGGLFSIATIIGFVGLTIWLIATGVGLFQAPRQVQRT
jgi:hypothetical protein